MNAPLKKVNSSLVLVLLLQMFLHSCIQQFPKGGWLSVANLLLDLHFAKAMLVREALESCIFFKGKVPFATDMFDGLVPHHGPSRLSASVPLMGLWQCQRLFMIRPPRNVSQSFLEYNVRQNSWDSRVCRVGWDWYAGKLCSFTEHSASAEVR